MFVQKLLYLLIRLHIAVSSDTCCINGSCSIAETDCFSRCFPLEQGCDKGSAEIIPAASGINGIHGKGRSIECLCSIFEKAAFFPKFYKHIGYTMV